jgi:hypothetical protein
MNATATNTLDIQQITVTLENYAAELADCICARHWEQLLVVLDSRQQYFETLDVHTKALKAAGLGEKIKQILREDNAVIAEIMQQKASIEQECLALMHSRRAVRAYQ